MEAATIAKGVTEFLRLRERIGVRGRLPDLMATIHGATEPHSSEEDEVDDVHRDLMELQGLLTSLLDVFSNPVRYYQFRTFLASYQSVIQAEFIEAALQFRRITSPARRAVLYVWGQGWSSDCRGPRSAYGTMWGLIYDAENVIPQVMLADLGPRRGAFRADSRPGGGGLSGIRGTCGVQFAGWVRRLHVAFTAVVVAARVQGERDCGVLLRAGSDTGRGILGRGCARGGQHAGGRPDCRSFNCGR